MRYLILFILISISFFAEESILDHNGILNPKVGVYYSSNWNYGLQFHYEKEKTNLFYLKLYSKIKKFDSKQESKNNFSTSLAFGFRYNFFSILIGFEKKEFYEPKLLLETKIYNSKSILFNFQEFFNKDKYYSISFLGGEKFKLGLGIGRTYFAENIPEWNASISISFQIEQFENTILANTNTENYNSSNTLLLNYNFGNSKNSILGEEFNNIEIEKVKNERKKTEKNELKIYELSIEELLRKKIPLKYAIQISKASKDKQSYKELIPKLPLEISKKCKALQYEKSIGEQNVQ